MSYVPQTGAGRAAPVQKIQEIRAVESIVFFGHGETIDDQAESEADEDLRSMSKSSGEQHSLSYSEIAWREGISAQGASEKFTMIVVSTSMGSPLSRVGRLAPLADGFDGRTSKVGISLAVHDAEGQRFAADSR